MNTDLLQAKFGEPISDDLINMYCDKLNTALNGKFDGMLALQYITLEPNDLDRLITGKKPVLQILFDRKREHYVLVEWKLFDKVVTIFDSLATQQENTATALNRRLAKQILNLFQHLFKDGVVVVRYETDIAKQEDKWSCGLRTIANITYRAFDEDPTRFVYVLSISSGINCDICAIGYLFRGAIFMTHIIYT
ncbi:unnamed protein product [Toxocara canis]|uniref:ULP_PROTEASE domain-containing protein n=1 Tax=Toxocara canis TaxID=6265 RepID=A0A183VCX4_TOXCA|nr:unnamed protein product [Toxocara canis]